MTLDVLHALAPQVPAETIDELWIFPTRRSGKSESAVVVASAFVSPGDDRRRIITAHRTIRPELGKKVAQEVITEQGIAPAERVPRLVEGVLRRLDEELAALTPRAVRIAGEVERWEELLTELAAAPAQGATPAQTAVPVPVPAPGSPSAPQ